MRSPEIRPGIRRLVRLALRRADDADAGADDEIRLHLQLRTAELVGAGWSPEAARAEAERRFGPVEEARAHLHTSARRREHRLRRTEWWDELRHDLRAAWRGVRRTPGVAAVVIATLAIGIGAATAIFSVINGVLLRPLAYPDAHRIAAVYTRFPALGVERGNLSHPERDDVAALPAFARVAAVGTGELTLTGGGTAGALPPETVRAAFLSAEAFAVLRAAPLHGRVYTAAEDRPGRDAVVVLGHAYWQRRFGGDPAVVGRTVVADGSARLITGVMPPDFAFGEGELFVPLAFDPAGGASSRGAHNYQVIARLAPGVTHAAAAAQLAALTGRLRRDHPGAYPPDAQFALHAMPLRDALVGDVRGALRVLAGAVGLVLLIACANAANLLLARGDARRRELAVRAALGAGRRRIARQLLTESVLLAVLAGAVGLGLAAAGTRALLAVNPDALPRHAHVGVDPAVAGGALLLSLLTGVLFGILPALQASRTDLHGLLRSGGRTGTARRRGLLRPALVVGELGLAVVVVVSAGLLVRSFVALRGTDAGLDPQGVLTLSTSLPSVRYPGARVAPTYDAILERIRAVPGVDAAGAVALLPIATEGWNWDVTVEGRAAPAGAAAPSPRPQIVTPGALAALRVPMARGRELTAADHADAPLVALVNETMARTLWPGADPLGRRFRLGGDERPWTTVVGVVRDVRSGGLREPAAPEFYVSLAQFRRFAGWTRSSMTLVVRTAGDPARLAPSVRRALAATDPELAAADVRTMRQVVDRSVAQPRFTMLLLSTFGGVALLLAAVGVYGVISYGVAQRTREFGIRTALGARRADVLRLVLGQGLGLAALGVGLGLVGALAATRALRSLVFAVRTTDPATYAAITVLLLGVAALASLVPARRATRADPTRALRQE